MEYQKTVADKVEFSGEGIFSGREVKVEIEPLRENEGIVFERADLPSKPRIRLSIDKVFGLDGAVVLSDGRVSIILIEHLLSLFHGVGIDNALVRVYGEEIPLIDGSVLPILRKIQERGYLFLPAQRRKLIIKKPFEVENGIGKISFKPAYHLEIKATIKFDHPLIGKQEFNFVLNPQAYLREISFARTFGFKALLEERKRQGILKGGNLSNAIVIDEDRVLNEDGLRAPDEFVRHKVLDIIGDLFVTGLPLLAKVEAFCTGHRLHIEALKTLYQAGLLEEIETKALVFFLLSKKNRLSL